MPSKTFHFGPDFEDVLEDLFEQHMVLSSLLEASTGIVAAPAPTPAAVSTAIARADIAWIHLWRNWSLTRR